MGPRKRICQPDKGIRLRFTANFPIPNDDFRKKTASICKTRMQPMRFVAMQQQLLTAATFCFKFKAISGAQHTEVDRPDGCRRLLSGV